MYNYESLVKIIKLRLTLIKIKIFLLANLNLKLSITQIKERRQKTNA